MTLTMFNRTAPLMGIAALLALMLAGRGEAVSSQAAVVVTGATDTTGPLARVPFGPGEHVRFQARLGGMSVGSGFMEVVGLETIDGNPTYHTRLQLSGGIPFARVDDKFDSWIDATHLFSRRFKQDQREVRFRRDRTYDFFPESRTYRRADNGEVGPIPTDRPLDDISFLYYARTLPLRVGDQYTIERYFKESGNPVVLTVLRKETVRVPAGTFETVVVRPVIKSRGLFGEGGEAEVYFTDDDRRMIVQIRSRVPVLGALTLQMVSYQEGTLLRTAQDAR